MSTPTDDTNAIANHDRLVALGGAIERRNGVNTRSPRGRGRGRSQSRRWGRRLAVAALAVVLVVAGVSVGDYLYLGSLLHHKHISFLQTAASEENILLIGSTDRCALKVQKIAYGLCQNGVTGVNSDIVMVLHLNLTTQTGSLLSVPRDTFVPNARTWGANKIDAALYQGPSQLVNAIEEDFGIPINHFVELNFDTFASVVNALGGVRMDFPTPVFDAESGLHISSPGCYFLDGYHALQVVRARHLQIQPSPGNTSFRTWPQEGQSDIARIRRTHEFLRVLAAKISANGLANPLTDQRLASSVIGNLQVDQNFSVNHMIALAEHFSSLNVGTLPQLTYPVAIVNGGSYFYKGYYYGDIEFPMNPMGTTTIQTLFGVRPAQNSFTYAALPAPHSFAVSVENGSNIAGQAAVVGTALHKQGFHITAEGTRTPTGPTTETIVWYGGGAPPKTGNWKSPALAAAQEVARRLSGPVVMGYNPAEVTPGALVTVQTGDLLSVIPVAKPTGKKPVKAAKSPAASLATGSTYVQAPTPVNEPLQPYDPRPCSPGQPQYVDHSP